MYRLGVTATPADAVTKSTIYSRTHTRTIAQQYSVEISPPLSSSRSRPLHLHHKGGARHTFSFP